MVNCCKSDTSRHYSAQLAKCQGLQLDANCHITFFLYFTVNNYEMCDIIFIYVVSEGLVRLKHQLHRAQSKYFNVLEKHKHKSKKTISVVREREKNMYRGHVLLHWVSQNAIACSQDTIRSPILINWCSQDKCIYRAYASALTGSARLRAHVQCALWRLPHCKLMNV